MSVRIGIVGCGILGVLTAFQMRKAMPAVQVTLYDRSLRGAGASQWSAGVHFPYGRSNTVREMTRKSEDFYRSVAPFATSQAIQSMHMQLPLLDAETKCHFTHPVTPEPANPLLQTLTRSGTSPLGFGCEGVQCADVYRLVQEIAAELSSTVEFREGVAVRAVHERGGEVRVTLSDDTETQQDVLILAPGPWSVSPEVAEWVQDLGLQIKRVVALHVSEPELSTHTPLAFFPEQDAFLLPRLERREWLFSYTNKTWEQDPETVGPTLSKSDLEAGQEVLQDIALALAGRCNSGQVFCDTYTPDRVPRIVPVGAAGRVIYAGGANGSGYRLAPAMASVARELTAAALGMEMSTEETS